MSTRLKAHFPIIKLQENTSSVEYKHFIQRIINILFIFVHVDRVHINMQHKQIANFCEYPSVNYDSDIAV